MAYISVILRHQGGAKGSHQTSIGDIARGDEDKDDGDEDEDEDEDDENDGSGSVAMVKL